MRPTTQITPAKLNQFIAKLHLEPGDSILFDAAAFDPQQLASAIRVPKGCEGGMVFGVFLVPGRTITESFKVMKERELRTVTRDILLKLLAITEDTDDSTP